MVPSLLWNVDFGDVARFCSRAGKHAAALDACAIGMQLRGRTAELLIRRAQAHDGLGNFVHAIADAAEALRCAPPPSLAARAGAVLAYALQSHGSQRAALAAARLAVDADASSVEAHCALGNVLAWSGDWDAAWPHLECHWLLERAEVRRRFGRDEWKGEDISRKRVVAVHLQGLGDLIQMARYFSRLRERCAHVTLECPVTLEPLMRGVPGIDAIVAPGQARARNENAIVRVMSLPRLLGERFDAPAQRAYLEVPAGSRVRFERARTANEPLRAGFAWAGNPFHQRNRERSLALAACARWAGIPNVRWTSLQIGPNANDAAESPLPLERHDDAVRSMGDTAALIAQQDLVISVDTSIAHLAGALGVPVLLMLPLRPDWRWPAAEHDTPWYRSMYVVHAREPGWDGAIADVYRRLCEWTEGTQRTSADRVDNSADSPKVSEAKTRRPFLSQVSTIGERRR